MKYSQLKIGDKVIEKSHEIEQKLKDLKFHWIIDSEFEEANIEIINNTIVWNSGTWYHGIWEYGIWLDGEFNGIWKNGILEGGNFKGEWESGIDYTETIKQEKMNESNKK